MTDLGIFKRTEILLGSDALKRIKEKKVIIFGVGGVGSWCAEALIRSGIEHLTIVDFDEVCETNINRQLMATTATIGEKKVEALKKRLIEINPNAEVNTIQAIYSKENYNEFKIQNYDYCIDAIDSLDNKIHLMQTACKTSTALFSSMGAALKMDPTKVRVAEFWKVKGCPMAASLRRKIKKSQPFEKKFLCVYSEELIKNKQTDVAQSIRGTSIDSTGLADETLAKKGQANGTVVFVTATFGLTLASLVIQDICNNN